MSVKSHKDITEDKIIHREKGALAYDFYAPLLTDKQGEALRLFYEEDLSQTEIAEFFGVSRQAAFDLLRRGEDMLAYYESALGLVRHHLRREQLLLRLKNVLTAVDDEHMEEALLLVQDIEKED